MINVSSEFKELMQKRTNFKQNAELTLADGTQISLNASDFTVSGNTVSDSAGARSLPIGIAVCRAIQMRIINFDNRYSEVDFFGATIRLYLTYQLSHTTEKVELGLFTVNSPETYGDVITITAVDDMYKSDKPYRTDLNFPATAKTVLLDACGQCGIAVGSTSFYNDSFMIDGIPEINLTFRQVIGYIAMIACGNARVNRSGYLEVLTYNFESDAVALQNWQMLKTDASDIVITGVQMTRTIDNEGEQTEEIVLSGQEGYVISVENPLAQGSEESLISILSGVLTGARFRRFDGEHVALPILEFMDLVDVVDRKGNVYRSFVSDITFRFFGYTAIKNSAETTLRQGRSYKSPTSKAIIAARKLVQEETAARENAIRQLDETIKNSSGMYGTSVKQQDGSVINYMHDRPTLEESQNVIKITADAIGISNDGGKTYLYGFTLDGDAIVRIIQAEGIDAEWIRVKEESQDGTSTINLQAALGGISSEISDTRTEISNVETSTTEQIAKSIQTSETMIFSVLENYVGESEYEVLQSAIASQLQILKDQIEINLTTSLNKASDVNNALQEQIDQITTYFRFTEEGQYIGRSDSEMQTRFANAIWEFLLNGVQQLYIDPDGVHGRQIHTDSLYIGNLIFQEQPDGSVIVS